MYIHSPDGFGDPQPVARQPSLGIRKPPFLAFLKIDKFNVDQSALTPPLKQAVKHLADSVKASWKTMQPIGVIRLVGHTDSSGAEQHNIGLGNRRADAVRQELFAQLGGLLNRVAIQIDPSPGKSKPTADNRTAAGRAANRRVEVFVEPPFVAPPTKRPPTPWPWPVPDPDRDGPWDPFRFKRGMPDPLKGKTPREFLMDVCRKKFGSGICKTMVDRGLSLGCKGIEALFERLGGSVTSAQKEEIQRQCRGWADKPL
jgi:outer membrane protein OmpA-like peptidoglycan-associated protein